ncbi:MAG: hypothetical protein KAT09_06650 [Candidatus Aegiribacteria sp.]|nr:hypothetical protein [Candidatus Aegiribacteria sp.]
MGSGIRNNDELRDRMESHLEAGEVIFAFGMGVIGTRTVLVAATNMRLILEKVTITFKRKELEYIMYDSLEAIEGRKGESSMPGWAKINIESAIMNRISTSVMIKMPGAKVIHIQFKPMPLFKCNGGKGIEIAQSIVIQRPEIKTSIDLKAERKDEPGCLVRALKWGSIGGIGGALIGAVAIRNTGGIIAFLIAGFFLGAVIAPFWRGLKTQITGRG